jgi:hypothetical protein
MIMPRERCAHEFKSGTNKLKITNLHIMLEEPDSNSIAKKHKKN